MDDYTDDVTMRSETYLSGSPLDEVEETLDQYFEGLSDLHNVEEKDSGEADYAFTSVGSTVTVDYELEEFEGDTRIDMEFSGSAPLVDRFHNEFSDEWSRGELSDL